MTEIIKVNGRILKVIGVSSNLFLFVKKVYGNGNEELYINRHSGQWWSPVGLYPIEREDTYKRLIQDVSPYSTFSYSKIMGFMDGIPKEDKDKIPDYIKEELIVNILKS